MAAVNTVNYVVTIDSDISTPTFLSPLLNIDFSRNTHPREDEATITLAGIQLVKSAREINIYRFDENGNADLKFRGMTTNPTYELIEDGLTTTVEVRGLWYMLDTRLASLQGLSPVGMQPNTNPYLVYLNPLLNLEFGQLFFYIVANSFQGLYSTGHLPTIVPFNFNVANAATTDFDTVVVNDQMTLRYVPVASAVDRLVSTALFSSDTNQPFLAEVFLDITQTTPTLSVVLFDPTHSVLGIGHNKSGRTIGDGIQPPPPYAGIGNFEQSPIDTIIFAEGTNIVSLTTKYDYDAMSDSFVTTGGDFMGSEVISIPLESPSSIADFGLKQSQLPLANVVDRDEIARYIDTSISFFQRPIPTITLVPDYAFASAHPIVVGDFVTLNAPSFRDVIVDSFGNPISDQTSNAFVARIRRIHITWNPTDGESIDYDLTFPVINVDETTTVSNTLQSMYGVTNPTASTTMGRSNLAAGMALHDSELGFVDSHPESHDISVVGDTSTLTPNWIVINIPALLQNQQSENNLQDVLLYGFWVQVSSTENIETVSLTILQPDGMAILHQDVVMNQKINVLSLLNKTRRSNGELVGDLSGNYVVALNNTDSSPTTRAYTVYAEYSYILNPSSATKAISFSEISNTTNFLNPTRRWVYRAPFIA
jgi:hypothetical protein